ncbi:synaptonemal complex central element protein 1-like [Varanus komodoensis]|uniref:synaptonemal complex central element protein 1-like n=1 Tax=Varanus komodoensis TaxID=61221 RepID=UPI001CF79DAD|nr:synaptonemal complex central element protein 1-like [Varanus komodoensis]XP_044287198.1 synaptonemal complex central element protein 1-like [Varanus komodoensis]
MEEILSLVKQMQNVQNLEPKIEDLVKRINKLQQAKKIISEEFSEANKHSNALQRELEKLHAEKSTLEEILNKKKEAWKIMQLHCEETKTEMQRQQKLNSECKQNIEELATKIHEEKLKQSKQRSKFQQQLDELIEKHKSLWDLYGKEKSVADLRDSKECLLNEEKLIQEKLAHVQEELDLLNQSALTEERKLLKSQQAAATLELFQEENHKAKEYLEAASKHNFDLQQRCSRVNAELKEFGMENGSLED